MINCVGFFSSGRNEAILRSSGIDPVDSDRLITVLNTGTRAEQQLRIMVAGRGSRNFFFTVIVQYEGNTLKNTIF